MKPSQGSPESLRSKLSPYAPDFSPLSVTPVPSVPYPDSFTTDRASRSSHPGVMKTSALQHHESPWKSADRSSRLDPMAAVWTPLVEPFRSPNSSNTSPSSFVYNKTPALAQQSNGRSPFEEWTGDEYKPPDQSKAFEDVTEEFKRKILEALGTSPVPNRLFGTECPTSSATRPYTKFQFTDFPPLENIRPDSLALGGGYDGSGVVNRTDWASSCRGDAELFVRAGVEEEVGTGLMQWSSLVVPLSFKPDVMSLSGSDILFGGPDGQMAISRHNEQQSTPIFCFESAWKKRESEDSLWVHLEVISDDVVVGVAQDGLHYAKFSDSRPVPKVKQFIPIPNNMPQTDSRLGWEHRRDKVSAVSSAAAIPHHWALGTEKGMVHWVDMEQDKVVQSINVNTIRSSLASNHLLNLSTPDIQTTPDSLISGISFRKELSGITNSFDSSSISTVQTPLVFGTMNGHMVLFDVRTPPKHLRRLRIFNGPILAVSRCDWDFVALGTDRYCSLDQIRTPDSFRLQTRQNLGRQVLSREVKKLAANEKWSTSIAVVDFRTLRLLEITSSDILARTKRCDINCCEEGSQTFHDTGFNQSDQLDFTKVVSIFDAPADPAAHTGKTTVPNPIASELLSSDLLSESSVGYQNLQLVDVKCQLSQHVLGLNIDGRVLSFQLSSTTGLNIVDFLTTQLPTPTLPVNFGTVNDRSLILLDASGALFGSRSKPVAPVSEADEIRWKPPLGWVSNVDGNPQIGIKPADSPEAKRAGVQTTGSSGQLDICSGDGTQLIPLNSSSQTNSIEHYSYYFSQQGLLDSSFPKLDDKEHTAIVSHQYVSSQQSTWMDLGEAQHILGKSHKRSLRPEHLSILSEWCNSRPPKQYRWLPSSAAIESLRVVYYRDLPSSRPRAGFRFCVHPLKEASCVRDAEALGYDVADILASMDGIQDRTAEVDKAELRSDASEYNSSESAGDEDSTNTKNEVNERLNPNRDYFDFHKRGGVRSNWETYLSPFQLKNFIHEPEEALGLLNRVGISGLELSSQFPMVNAVVQVLRFIPQLEQQIVRHQCEKETCLACELGLLWHMLDLASEEGRGRPCRAKNFLYTFTKIPEVRLCRLIPEDYLSKEGPLDDLGKSVQIFLVFLLQHLRRELNGDSDDTPHNSSPKTSPAVFEIDYDRNSRPTTTSPSCPGSPYITATSPTQYPRPYRNIVDFLFGCSSETTSVCVTHQHTTKTSPVTRFIIDLISPSVEFGDKRLPTGLYDQSTPVSQTSDTVDNKCKMSMFQSVLKASLERRFLRGGFCQSCGRSGRIQHKERVTHVPPVLAVNCRTYFNDTSGLDVSTLPLEFWLNDNKDKGELELSMEDPSYIGKNEQLPSDELPTLVPSKDRWRRYELMATIFVVNEKSPPRLSDDAPVGGYGVGSSLLVPKRDLSHHGDKDYTWSFRDHGSPEYDGFSEGSGVGPCKDYLLSPDHLVTHVKVPRSQFIPQMHRCFDAIHNGPSLVADVSEAGSGVEHPDSIETDSEYSDTPDPELVDALSTSSKSTGESWVTLNDFVVTFADEAEVVDTKLPWKRSSCLFYLCKEQLNTTEFKTPVLQTQSLNQSKSQCPIPRSVILKDVNLSRHPAAPRSPDPLFTPFSEAEAVDIEEHGRVLSLDAEFVLMKRTQDLREDCLSFARLSVIRGDGPLEGVPCLDCHILTHQIPEDYLTRFSGLNPGDLDETYSRFWLTTRKCVYRKLRYLLDNHCTFIGHGLSKDFSIINLFVPKSQILDTVQLFRLPGRRLLSLKFLAYHILRISVQHSDFGHDSVEDAFVALQLYKHYKEYEKSGDLYAVLRYLYKIGTKTRWVVPSQSSLFGGHKNSMDAIGR